MANNEDVSLGVSYNQSQLIRFRGRIVPEGINPRANVPVEIVEVKDNVEHIIVSGVTGSDGSYNLTGRFSYDGSVSVFARCGEDISGQWSVEVLDDRGIATITLASSSNTMLKNTGSVTLSGTLSVGSGYSVKLYDDNGLIDTLTTGTDGDFSKTINNNSIVGVKNYYAVFEGDDSYHDCTSSTVSVYTITETYMELTVEGDTFKQLHSGSVLTNSNNENIIIDYGDNTLTVYDGDYTHDYSVTGTYTVKMYNVTGLGAECFAYLNGTWGKLTEITLHEGITSIGNHCFNSTSLTSLVIPSSVTSIGGYAFQAGFTQITLPWNTSNKIVQYLSTWNWTGWASGFKFIIPEGTTSLYTAKNYPSNLLQEDVDYNGIELLSDKDILSAYDGESATLTAQLMNGTSPVAVSGESVTFEVRKTSDDSLVETLTGTTDSSGLATVSYLGKGTGDLYIQSFSSDRIISSETFAIRDVHFYDSMTSDSGHWTYDNGITKSYSSDGVSITASSDKWPVCDVALPNNFKLTFKAKSNSNNNLRYCVLGGWYISNGAYSSINRIMLYNGWPPQYYVNNTYSQPNVVEFEAEYNNGVLTVKKDGTTLITQAITLDNQVLQLYTGGNTTVTIKDIIVEEL